MRCWQKSGRLCRPPRGGGIDQIAESVGETRLYYDRLEPEKSSLPVSAQNGRKADRENPAISDETSALWLSQNSGLLEARRDKDQFEKSTPVMETGEIEFAEEATIKKASQTNARNNAESGKSKSGVDV